MSLQQSKGIIPLVGNSTGSDTKQEKEHNVTAQSKTYDEIDVPPDNPDGDSYIQPSSSMLS